MSEYKCPFSAIQSSGTCHCQYAREVVRRGGSEYLCKEPDSSTLCNILKEHLNRLALPALGYEDDLTLTPKSIYERIMVGGLQGLRMAHNPADSATETANIWAVVAVTHQKYPYFDGIPNEDVILAIKNCKLRKRRRQQ